MIKTKLTKRAQRWLENHCLTNDVKVINLSSKESTITKKPVVCEIIDHVLTVRSNGSYKKIPIQLNCYTYNNQKVNVREFIQGYKFVNNNIVVYLALKFENEKYQKVICSLWNYQSTNKKSNDVLINYNLKNEQPV
jgi:hypothetical protein